MQATTPAQPWWKFGHVWLVVSGPAAVVMASFFTFYLAYHGSDPLVDENYYQKGMNINQQLEGAAAASLAPAVQGRNHAATGAPAPKAKP
jgi:hypothetical protein